MVVDDCRVYTLAVGVNIADCQITSGGYSSRLTKTEASINNLLQGQYRTYKRELVASVWSFVLQGGRPPEPMLHQVTRRRTPQKLEAHQRSPEADSSCANVTPMKSWAELGSVSELVPEKRFSSTGGFMRCSCLAWTPRGSIWNGAMSTLSSANLCKRI